jgi:hypothetical protein
MQPHYRGAEEACECCIELRLSEQETFATDLSRNTLLDGSILRLSLAEIDRYGHAVSAIHHSPLFDASPGTPEARGLRTVILLI